MAIDDTGARDPRGEAQDLAGEGLEARVLEPSPPAVREEPWYADDPTAPGEVPPGRRLLSPVPGGDLTWDEWLAENPWHSGWAAARWLGARPRLRRPGPAHAATRLALHRVAAYAVSPARRRANGKIGLRFTLGGFGTPFFGADEQVRVEGDRLVRQRGDQASSEPITTLAAAAFAFGGPPDLEWAARFDVPPAGDLEAPLEIDPGAAADLADWYGFAWSALEELRTDPASSEASRVQLWPEHFDAAIELLAGDRRASYGASPGDAAVPEPYVYVVPWDGARAGDGDNFWNADSFRGAILPLEDFLATPDQRAAVLDFWRWGRDLLGS